MLSLIKFLSILNSIDVPDTRTAFILIKSYNFFGENCIVSNIDSSGMNIISVPFSFLLHLSILIFVLALPFEYNWEYFLPPLNTFTSREVLRAFTTEIPTPCKPPEVLYELLSNLPPAWRVVSTISNALLFLILGWKSIGIPLPLSLIFIEPSLL